MVDRADIGQINMLYSQANVIQAALWNFDNGGTIIAFTVAGGQLPTDATPAEAPAGQSALMPRLPPLMANRAGLAVQVPTDGWPYPAAMVTAIRTLLEQRLKEIDSELEQLGVTPGA